MKYLVKSKINGTIKTKYGDLGSIIVDDIDGELLRLQEKGKIEIMMMHKEEKVTIDFESINDEEKPNKNSRRK